MKDYKLTPTESDIITLLLSSPYQHYSIISILFSRSVRISGSLGHIMQKLIALDIVIVYLDNGKEYYKISDIVIAHGENWKRYYMAKNYNDYIIKG